MTNRNNIDETEACAQLGEQIRSQLMDGKTVVVAADILATAGVCGSDENNVLFRCVGRPFVNEADQGLLVAWPSHGCAIIQGLTLSDVSTSEFNLVAQGFSVADAIKLQVLVNRILPLQKTTGENHVGNSH